MREVCQTKSVVLPNNNIRSTGLINIWEKALLLSHNLGQLTIPFIYRMVSLYIREPVKKTRLNLGTLNEQGN